MVNVKKIVIILFICIFIIALLSSVSLKIIKYRNNNLQKEINNLKVDNTLLDNENNDYIKSINVLKEENKDKWEELEIWEKAKNKLNNAITE